MWFYNPFVRKLRQPGRKMPPGNTPFMLIAQPVQRLAAVQYQQNGDELVLTPKASNGNLKQFTINVGRDGTIHQFSAVEQDD
ncbi:outer membrane lipoprotein chaperone LolA [Escherichia coli]